MPDKWDQYIANDSASTDKWAKYAVTVETPPDPTKPAPGTKPEIKMELSPFGGAHTSEKEESAIKAATPEAMENLKAIRKGAFEIGGSMLGGGLASKGPGMWGVLMRALGTGTGAGLGNLAVSRDPKEAAKTGAMFGGMELGTEGVIAGGGKLLETPLVKQVLKSRVTQLEEKHAAEAAEIKAKYQKELASHQEEVAKVKRANEQKAVEHEARLQRIEERYQKRVSEHQAKVQQADLDYQKRLEEHKRRVDEIKKDYSEKLAEHQKATKEASVQQSQAMAKKGLAAEHQNDMAGLVKENLELTKEKIGKDLGSEFAKVNDAVQAKNPKVSVSNVEREARGYLFKPDSVAAFNNIMERVSGNLETADFSTLRKAYSDLTDILYGRGELPSDLHQAVRVLQKSLGKDLRAAADKAGLGGKYSKAMSDYSDFKDVWEDTSAIAKGGSPIRRILDAKDPAFVIDQFKGKAGERLLEDIGKYSKYGADKPLAGQFKQFIERVESFPSSAPDLPKSPGRPAIPKTPERGAAPKLPEAPYKPKAPQPKEAPKRPEQPSLEPFDREAVARAIIAERIRKALLYGSGLAGGGYLYEKFGQKLKKLNPIP